MTLKRQPHYGLVPDHSETLMMPRGETSSDIESIRRQGEQAAAEAIAIAQVTVTIERGTEYIHEVGNEVFLEAARHADAIVTLAQNLTHKDKVERFVAANLELLQKHELTV